MTATPQIPVYMRRYGFDPAPELAELRDGPGIGRVRSPLGNDVWVVTRFADVRQVLGDPRRFVQAPQLTRTLAGTQSSDEEAARSRAGDLLAMNPPEHSRLRRLLTPEFTVRRMQRLEPHIHQIVEERLDAMQRSGSPANLVADFALPVPSLVICELLGVPYADRAEFQRLSDELLDLSMPADERFRLMQDAREYIAGLVRKAQVDPGDDIIGMLVREHADQVDSDELTGIALLLLIAGHETTANMLALGTLALLRNPSQLEIVRGEPEQTGAAVEELLRWLTVLHFTIDRMTTTDVEIAGQRIPAGDIVICALAAANATPQSLRIRIGSTSPAAR